MAEKVELRVVVTVTDGNTYENGDLMDNVRLAIEATQGEQTLETMNWEPIPMFPNEVAIVSRERKPEEPEDNP